jgi:ribosomal protein S18 acetylase RimI-like enzyme
MPKPPLAVSYRPARSSDSETVARLFFQTMGTLGSYVFGRNDPEETIRFLARIYPLEGHRYSVSFSTLAESDGAAVGLLHAIPGRELARATRRLVQAVWQRHGPRDAFGLMRRAWPLAFEPDATEEEYYIECLSVAPACQNRGIGALLLAEADRQASKAGYRYCSLGVFFENEGAQRLYERSGFRVERKVFTRLHAPGVGYEGFYRMVKPLPPPEV